MDDREQPQVSKEIKRLQSGGKSPFVVLNLVKLRDNIKSLKKCLPDVEIHYAIKSLSDEHVLSCIHLVGCKFDVATSGEIKILEKLGVNGEDCIHTHPIKKISEIQYAIDYGIKTFVVDNIDELQKFIHFKDQVEILLRVSFRAKTALVDLSKKFGCKVDDADYILSKAKEYGIIVKGLSFHVGSQTKNPDDHVTAIKECTKIINNHPTLTVLDIGGGFPAVYDSSDMDIKTFTVPIREALSLVPKHVKLICEPGRHLVANIGTAYMTIVGKAIRDGIQWYYVDDGVYGTFSGKIYDHIKYDVKAFGDYPENATLAPCILAGPTCDSIDIIQEDAMLPIDELEIGDMLYSINVGAYTLVTASTFNSLPLPNVLYIW